MLLLSAYPVGRRRVLALSATLLSGVAGLAACGGSTAAPAAGASTTAVRLRSTSAATSESNATPTPTGTALPTASGTFNVFLPSAGGLAAGWKLLTPRFERANPDLKVEVNPTLSLDKLQATIAAGTPPDVTHFDRYQVVTWAVKGLFQPVDDLLRGLNPPQTFLAPALKEATYKGKLYAMPQDTGIRGLFWNTAQLQQAGLDARQGPKRLGRPRPLRPGADPADWRPRQAALRTLALDRQLVSHRLDLGLRRRLFRRPDLPSDAQSAGSSAGI